MTRALLQPFSWRTYPRRSVLNAYVGLVLNTILLTSLVVLAGCQKGDSSAGKVGSGGTSGPARSSTIWFEERAEITEKLGVHYADPEQFEMPGIMGSGCALSDLNGDGLLDIVLVPGDPQLSEKSAAPDGNMSGKCRVLVQKTGLTWHDASSDAGLVVDGTGMGCYFGDIDNDGDSDVLTTGSRGIRLFRNDSSTEKIQFTDTTPSSGLASSRWSTAACFFDYDRDGWLDLFVVNYVDYFPGSQCHDASGRLDYCGPQSFTGTSDFLFRNRGAAGQPGTFENVTVAAGIARAVGKGLGVICSDMTGDRLADIYVANDMEPNFLWVQQSDGTFAEEAVLRGCAVDIQGRSQASMGTAFSDLDEDAQTDLFLTHLRGETNTWYRQLGMGVFLDETARTGLGETSRNYTGFGVVVADFDHDSHLDIAVANGRVMRAPILQADRASSRWGDYAESNLLWTGKGGGQFELTSADDPFQKVEEISRGLASGDVDGDGDVDLLISSVAAPARFFENRAAKAGHWLGVQVVDPRWNRDAIGAKVVVSFGGEARHREVMPNLGYLSSHDCRLHFGLGESAGYDSIQVYWPDETSGFEQFPGGPADQMIRLERGKGVRSEHVDVERGSVQ